MSEYNYYDVTDSQLHHNSYILFYLTPPYFLAYSKKQLNHRSDLYYNFLQKQHEMEARSVANLIKPLRS